jgi:hypothetical protein
MIGLLRYVASEFAPGFQDRMNSFLNPKRVRGFHLSVDPYWLAWFRSHWAGRAYPWEDPSGYFYWREDSWREDPAGLLRRFREDYLRPPDWDDHCKAMGYPRNPYPVIFRVIFRDPSDLEELRDLPNNHEAFPIVYESRPVCRALAQPTASPTLAFSGAVGKMPLKQYGGSIGGFLRDTSTNTLYLVSCAHVLGDVGETTYASHPGGVQSPTEIGQVELSVLAPPNAVPSCNNRTHALPDALDLALTELRPGLQPEAGNPSSGPQHLSSFNAMSSQDHVFLFGERSGRVDAELGSLCVYHEIEVDSQVRCFGDIFTVAPPRPWYLNRNLVKDGDSGSWIVRSLGGITSWDGMLFAGDGVTGYGCFAENIMTTARQSFAAIALVS